MFREKQELRIPGPAPVPPSVLRAAGKPMINHRGAEFKAMLPQVLERLRPLFGLADGVIHTLSGSGTAAMETAVVNLVKPGDPVLVLVGGFFGERWNELLQRHGARVVELQFSWGTGVSPEVVRDKLKEHPEVQVIFATQNESSTGVLHDVSAIAQAKGKERLLVVDAVSALGGVPMEMDAWGVDVVCSASQKCLMCPPGLALIALSTAAWDRVNETKGPRYYFDLRIYQRMLERREPPFTPNLPVFWSLVEALNLLEEEGLAAVFARHRLMRDMIRAGAKALGLGLLVKEAYASPTTTAITPNGVDVEHLRRVVRERFNIELAGGQGPLAGQLFRVGHMGYAAPLDMLAVLAALEMYVDQRGTAVAAAEEVWQSSL